MQTSYKENTLYRSGDGMICEIAHFTPGNQMIVACYYADGSFGFCRTLYTTGKRFLHDNSEADLIEVVGKPSLASFSNGFGSAIKPAPPRIKSILAIMPSG